MISRLHYITQDIAGYTHAQLAARACAAGVHWVQLRLKNVSPDHWRQEALDTQAVCQHYGAKLIINDNVALAQEIGADGIHLGLQDMSTKEARKQLGPGMIIGGTANTFEDIQMHAAAGVDYVGVGPFRFTSTKEKLSPILGLEGYQKIISRCRAAGITQPLLAIGGVTAADVPDLLAAGLHGIAVSSVINKSDNAAAAVQALWQALEESTTTHPFTQA
ncbi:thiamine phosphate synthase [Rufibacter immobilis]|uniref:Thiamine-phosphate synthase n=1 Tax=Rufibacter immobilis TaxID=1348778 RepID=A0A3M9MR92_9BACT|nr:thiamine phosphate synthase [Rufibacter immobilis]RNI27228.1 thiamine phosphate synthase [Rufibacter immobilis]